MADMFMKLGDIKGEVQDAAHQDEIEVLVWGWGFSQAGATSTGAGTGAGASGNSGGGSAGTNATMGGGAGKLEVQDLSFTKFTDRGTPLIIAACATGKRLDSAVLTMRKASGDAALEYYRITLGGVLVSAYASGGSAGEGRFTENVTLNFERFLIEYQPHDAQSGKEGDMVQVQWNLRTNAPS